MKKTLRVLIAIDSHNREFIGAQFLKRALEDKKFVVEICSRYVLRYTYNRFKPNIVFVHSCHKVPEIEKIAETAIIVLLQAESYTGNAECIIELSTNRVLKDTRFDLVDIRYCWGEIDYKLLQEHNLFPQAALELSGHPITDVWYSKKSKKSNSNKKPVIGITSSLRAMTHIAGAIKNPVQLVLSIEESGRAGFFDPPNHAESWIAYEAAWIRIIGSLIKELKDYEILLRPHPIEQAEYYKFLEKYPNVKVSNTKNIVVWLNEVDTVLSYLSGSQLDAYVRGKNVLSLRNLFPNFVTERLPKMLAQEQDQYFYAPISNEDLINNLNTKKHNEVALNRLLKEIFNYPAKQRPSQAIAEHLEQFVQYYDLTKKQPFKELPEGRLRILPNYCRKDDLSLMYRDLYGKITNKENVSLSFCRHRIFRNHRDLKLADYLALHF